MSRYSDDRANPGYIERLGPALLELAHAEIKRFRISNDGQLPRSIRMTDKERYALMGTAFRGRLGYEQNGEGFSAFLGVPIVVDESASLLHRGVSEADQQ